MTVRISLCVCMFHEWIPLSLQTIYWFFIIKKIHYSYGIIFWYSQKLIRASTDLEAVAPEGASLVGAVAPTDGRKSLAASH